MLCSILVPVEFKTKIARKLHKLSAKAGVEIEELEGLTQIGTSDPTLLISCARYTVGEMPVSAWRFVARIEHTAGGNLIASAPGETVPPEYRETAPICQHCDTKRARKDTFLLQNRESGKYQLVGRNCLADFLRHSPTQIIAQAELSALIGEAGRDDWFGCSPRCELATDHFVACAIASIDDHGWRRSGEAQSTRDDARFRAWPCFSRDENILKIWRSGQPTDEHRARAANVLKWAAEQSGQLSNYEHNLKIAAGLKTCSHRHEGLLASLYDAWRRSEGKAAERRQPAKQASAGFLGTIGERITVSAVLLGLTEYETDWGTGCAFRFQTAQGHKITWFSSGSNVPDDDQIGQSFKLTGRVKAHQNYKDTETTILTRCKFQSE